MFDPSTISKRISELKTLGRLFLENATKLEQELDIFQDPAPPKGSGLSSEEKMKILMKRNSRIPNKKN